MSKTIIQKEIGRDRWSEGAEHHPKSVELMHLLQELDSAAYGSYFDWRIGGAGDNGETLMYQMDAYFEARAASEGGVMKPAVTFTLREIKRLIDKSEGDMDYLLFLLKELEVEKRKDPTHGP